MQIPYAHLNSNFVIIDDYSDPSENLLEILKDFHCIEENDSSLDSIEKKCRILPIEEVDIGLDSIEKICKILSPWEGVTCESYHKLGWDVKDEKFYVAAGIKNDDSYKTYFSKLINSSYYNPDMLQAAKKLEEIAIDTHDLLDKLFEQKLDQDRNHRLISLLDKLSTVVNTFNLGVKTILKSPLTDQSELLKRNVLKANCKLLAANVRNDLTAFDRLLNINTASILEKKKENPTIENQAWSRREIILLKNELEQKQAQNALISDS